MLRLSPALILSLWLSAVARAGEGVPLEVTIENRSQHPLRCLLVFAHWTTLDLPLVAPGGEISIALNRAADRALFVPRPQDARPMMLEALHCGADGRWSETLLRLDWTIPMRSEERSFRLACDGEDRPSCAWREVP